jgi:ribosomal protein S27E
MGLGRVTIRPKSLTGKYMHRLTVPPGHGLYAKCPGCKQFSEIKVNQTSGPITLAFNHPKQQVKAKCTQCGQELEWVPEEAQMRKIGRA